ncbi:MAG: LamG-like jellyroll fold domain-containing protein [Bacteroidota bacterium]|nr:LamG-like jellyroll fold domain-containing protein [Bacteroidota bacterium]
MKKCILLFSIQFVLGLSLFSQINLDSLLVAYYPFNGNANDESGNGNNGAVTGAIPVEDRFGNPDAAYSFNGFTDYIEFGDVFNDVFLPFAISVWIYKEQVGPPFQNIFKSDNYPGTGSNYYYGFWLTTVNENEQSTVSISYCDGGGVEIANRRTKNSTSMIYLNQWVHLAINVNGPTDMAIYFNTFDVGGTYSGSGGNMVHSDWTANMGRNTLPPNIYLNGILDDVRIYNRILTLDEITALYEEGTHVNVYENSTIADSKISLYQNFPNPCTDAVQLHFTFHVSHFASIDLYSISGVRIERLLDEVVMRGTHEFEFDVSALPAGVYFLMLQAGQDIAVRKLIVVD